MTTKVLGKSKIRYRSLAFFGYPNYRVGDDGSVWSRFAAGGHTISTEWRRKKPTASCGHLVVNLSGESGRKVLYVHHLVLLAFVGTCPDGMEGCHYDGNYRNNRLENLRWDTHSNNEKDKFQHGTSHFSGESHYGAKLTVEKVRKIRRLYGDGVYSMNQLAVLFGVALGTIYPIIHFKTWKNV